MVRSFFPNQASRDEGEELDRFAVEEGAWCTRRRGRSSGASGRLSHADDDALWSRRRCGNTPPKALLPILVYTVVPLEPLGSRRDLERRHRATLVPGQALPRRRQEHNREVREEGDVVEAMPVHSVHVNCEEELECGPSPPWTVCVHREPGL
jgi:hypothetical protein